MRKMAVLILALAVANAGCMSLANFVLYVMHGMPKFPAEYEGLQGKRVAVVCVSAANSYGPDAMTNRVAREVQSQLAAHVQEIDVVRDSEVSDWMDHHDWSQLDYTEVGRGVNADMVVAIELNQPLVFREGPTLSRGTADYTVTVYDVNDNSGEKVFRRREEEFQWPSQARYGVSESKFESAFIKRLGKRAAHWFHANEEHAEIGENTSDVSGF